jgi:hypothetical protein
MELTDGAFSKAVVLVISFSLEKEAMGKIFST